MYNIKLHVLQNVGNDQYKHLLNNHCTLKAMAVAITTNCIHFVYFTSLCCHYTGLFYAGGKQPLLLYIQPIHSLRFHCRVLVLVTNVSLLSFLQT